MALFLRLPYWVKCTFAIWMVFGAAPILTRILGFQYLPSPEWVSQVSVLTAIAGVIFAFCFTWVAITAMEIRGQRWLGFKIVLALLFAPFFGFSIGGYAISISAPMLGTAIYGAEIETKYTVKKIWTYGDSKCRRPVILDDLPSLFDKLCGFPVEFTRTLRPGERIIVSGYGTRLGVFAHSARRGD